MSRKREGRRATYVKAAAHRIIEELAGVGSGGRNNALNVAAFAMGQLVQPGGLDERDAELELTRAGAELGLSANEVKQTVKSGLSKGMNKPRELPCDDDDEEAVRLMNDSKYGLTASIWTSDPEAMIAIGDRIETGTVYMNRCDYVDPSLVWTGVKDTGRGQALSALGFDSFTRVKSFHLKTV